MIATLPCACGAATVPDLAGRPFCAACDRQDEIWSMPGLTWPDHDPRDPDAPRRHPLLQPGAVLGGSVVEALHTDGRGAELRCACGARRTVRNLSSVLHARRQGRPIRCRTCYAGPDVGAARRCACGEVRPERFHPHGGRRCMVCEVLLRRNGPCPRRCGRPVRFGRGSRRRRPHRCPCERHLVAASAPVVLPSTPSAAGRES